MIYIYIFKKNILYIDFAAFIWSPFSRESTDDTFPWLAWAGHSAAELDTTRQLEAQGEERKRMGGSVGDLAQYGFESRW